MSLLNIKKIELHEHKVRNLHQPEKLLEISIPFLRSNKMYATNRVCSEYSAPKLRWAVDTQFSILISLKIYTQDTTSTNLHCFPSNVAFDSLSLCVSAVFSWEHPLHYILTCWYDMCISVCRDSWFWHRAQAPLSTVIHSTCSNLLLQSEWIR